MKVSSINEFFAENSDIDICRFWVLALENTSKDQSHFPLSEWLDTWRVAWIVYTYIGVWEGDGIGSVWSIDPEHLELFVESLNIIGAGYAGDYISRSLEAISSYDLNDQSFTSSSEFDNLKKYWDMDLLYYTQRILGYLSSYLRSNRMECDELIDTMISIKKTHM